MTLRLLSFLFIVMHVSGFPVIAQQAYESQITFNKKKQKAIVIDYPYSQEAVQNAIVKKLEKMGHIKQEEKGFFNKDKGFVVFKGAVVSDVNEDKMDYILKVERKSRKEKDESTLYLVFNKGEEDAIPGMSSQQINKAKKFLNDLLPEVEDEDLELQIKAQDDVVVKSEKKFKELQDQKTELEKKLKKNLEDLEIQQRQIETQRGALDSLKGKRRGGIL